MDKSRVLQAIRFGSVDPFFTALYHKDSPSPPPPPDYRGAAVEQGKANVTSAQQGAVLSNPNINSPYGSQSVSYSPLGGNNPDTANFLSPTITQTLNPQSQQIFDAQNATKLGLAGLGQQGIGTAQQALGSPFSYNGPGIQTSLGDYGSVQDAPNLTGMGQAQRTFGDYGKPQTGLDLSGVARMPVNAGMTGQNAIMSRLQPQIERERQQYETQLRNQGLVAGGEAYNNGMTIQNQRENDLLNQAALSGIGLDLTANQQGYNQALNTGQFYNSGQQQGYNQALGAGQFSNQGLAQNQNAALQQQQAQNQAQTQRYNQQLGSGQFANTAQQQALQQQLYQRNLPLNEITALMSGSQIQNPQFQAYQGQNIAPPPLMNAAGQQAQYNQGIYGLGVGQQNAQMGGLASLGSAGLGMYGMLGKAAPFMGI